MCADAGQSPHTGRVQAQLRHTEGRQLKCFRQALFFFSSETIFIIYEEQFKFPLTFFSSTNQHFEIWWLI